MSPTLSAGDQVFWDPKAYIANVLPQVGEIVVARDPREPDRSLVKRVVAIASDGNGGFSAVLRGDNPNESTDSRQFGAVDVSQILGKVTSRLP